MWSEMSPYNHVNKEDKMLFEAQQASEAKDNWDQITLFTDWLLTFYISNTVVTNILFFKQKIMWYVITT
jgi:hypothetical protein